MTMDFTGKTVLVTGGSRGIGREVAVAFANHGARVAVHYRAKSGAALETVNKLPGDHHIVCRADIAKPDEAQKLVETVVQKFGSLDIVVNNAGIVRNHPIDTVNYREWQDAWNNILSVNLTGPANVCYCVSRFMMENGGGRIVNISSRGAFRGEPDMPAYGASKAGLNAMSQSLAQKLAPYNIFVGVVAPGFVETDMGKPYLEGPQGDSIRNQSPLGRVARPEEVAYAALFLASEGAQFTTGTIIDVNGASYLRS